LVWQAVFPSTLDRACILKTKTLDGLARVQRAGSVKRENMVAADRVLLADSTVQCGRDMTGILCTLIKK
jgi:hypothetical protein